MRETGGFLYASDYKGKSVSTAKLNVRPLDINFSLKDKVYDALRQAIMSMDIYASSEELRLDERQLAEDLGVSRTPIREAITRLEQEGFVRVAQRKGVFVVRKTKQEILEMIVAWAALEGMAARLITSEATDGEIQTLRAFFADAENNQLMARIDEYSDKNIQFHQQILRLSKNRLINEMADNLFAHMRSIRHRTIGESNRAERSIIDHMHIIEAIEDRDAELAERLVRQHSLDLAAHVKENVHYLD